nr:ATP-binding protein [Enterocloster clostridioformis]
MKLRIRNVAKIEEADLELNGITIIAGNNNTGKSTIGKIVFSLCGRTCHTGFGGRTATNPQRICWYVKR